MRGLKVKTDIKAGTYTPDKGAGSGPIG
jgi:hypothetical protein